MHPLPLILIRITSLWSDMSVTALRAVPSALASTWKRNAFVFGSVLTGAKTCIADCACPPQLPEQNSRREEHFLEHHWHFCEWGCRTCACQLTRMRVVARSAGPEAVRGPRDHRLVAQLCLLVVWLVLPRSVPVCSMCAPSGGNRHLRPGTAAFCSHLHLQRETRTVCCSRAIQRSRVRAHRS